MLHKLKRWEDASIHFINKLNAQKKQCARPPASIIDDSASSIHLNGAILHSVDVPYTWKPWEVDSIAFQM
jgi:hypothetical protein